MAVASIQSNFLRLEDLENPIVRRGLGPAKRLFLSFLISPDTSKHDHSATVYGGQGNFLSSLAALSILTVTSHHYALQSHSTLILHHSRPAARLVPAPTRHTLSCREHGTRVHVQDLFGNMPVRVKQRTRTCDGREQEKLWEKLVQKLIALVLAWGLPVTLVLKNPEGAKKLLIRGRGILQQINTGAGPLPNLFDASWVRSVLSQAAYIEPLDWNKWIETSAITSSISICGAISLRPAPSKRVQFISLGIHPVNPDLHRILYDEVNQAFASSDFGKEIDDSEPEGNLRRKKGRRFKESEITAKKLKGGAKGADRWPMFFIRIDLLSGPQLRLTGDLDNVREDALLRISSTLRTMIMSFLKDHHFRPHTKRARLHEKVDIAPTQKDLPVEISQDARSGLLPLASADLGSFAKNHTVPTAPSASEAGLSTGFHGSELSCGSNFISRSAQSQKPSHRSLYSEHGFSTWNRIKSGQREELDELLSQKAVPFRQHAPLKDTNAETDLASVVSPPHPAKGLAVEAGQETGEQNDRNEDIVANGSSEAEYLPADRAYLQENAVVTKSSEDDHTLEEVTQWTNPVTGATVFLSTRTGREVRRTLMQPVSSKSETKTPCVGSSKMGVPKLLQSSSDQFSHLKEGSWIRELLHSWNNPVFKPCEESIPSLSFGSLDGASSGQQRAIAHSCFDIRLPNAFTESASLFAAKFSKDALGRSRLIAQVDRKFLLVCMEISPGKGVLEEEEEEEAAGLHPPGVLVLIDQHAADERIRLEEILADLCRGPSPEARIAPAAIHPQSAIATIILPRPITFAIHHREGHLFMADASHFAEWGILYSLEPRKEQDQSKTLQPAGFQLIVRALPEAIAERCRVDPKMLIDLLRSEVWKRQDAGLAPKVSTDPALCSPSSSMKANSVAVDGEHQQPRPDWLRRVGNCPQGMLDLIYSRACRSAIMFNDPLTEEECKLLLQKLSKCAFPFQCAHGRPSMIPLVRVGGEERGGDGFGIANGRLGSKDQEERRNPKRAFGAALRRWMKEQEEKGQEGEVVEA